MSQAAPTAPATTARISVGSGSFTSWSAGSGATGALIGGTEQATEVIVNGADVTGVRVVVRRRTPQ